MPRRGCGHRSPAGTVVRRPGAVVGRSRGRRRSGPGAGSEGVAMNKGVAHLVCGRRAKWLVGVLWLVGLFVAAPFAMKLTDAQDNDAASWLPGSAESTQVLQESENFRPAQIPAVVKIGRASGRVR